MHHVTAALLQITAALLQITTALLQITVPLLKITAKCYYKLRQFYYKLRQCVITNYGSFIKLLQITALQIMAGITIYDVITNYVVTPVTVFEWKINRSQLKKKKRKLNWY